MSSFEICTISQSSFSRLSNIFTVVVYVSCIKKKIDHNVSNFRRKRKISLFQLQHWCRQLRITTAGFERCCSASTLKSIYNEKKRRRTWPAEDLALWETPSSLLYVSVSLHIVLRRFFETYFHFGSKLV